MTDEEFDATYLNVLHGRAAAVKLVRSDSEGEREGDSRLFGALCYALGASGGLLDARAIVEMLDHKGTLTVTWRDRLSLIRYRRIMERAWQEFGNECDVSHAVGSRDNVWSDDD